MKRFLIIIAIFSLIKKKAQIENVNAWLRHFGAVGATIFHVLYSIDVGARHSDSVGYWRWVDESMNIFLLQTATFKTKWIYVKQNKSHSICNLRKKNRCVCGWFVFIYAYMSGLTINSHFDWTVCVYERMRSHNEIYIYNLDEYQYGSMLDSFASYVNGFNQLKKLKFVLLNW